MPGQKDVISHLCPLAVQAEGEPKGAEDVSTGPKAMFADAKQDGWGS